MQWFSSLQCTFVLFSWHFCGLLSTLNGQFLAIELCLFLGLHWFLFFSCLLMCTVIFITCSSALFLLMPNPPHVLSSLYFTCSPHVKLVYLAFLLSSCSYIQGILLYHLLILDVFCVLVRWIHHYPLFLILLVIPCSRHGSGPRTPLFVSRLYPLIRLVLNMFNPLHLFSSEAPQERNWWCCFLLFVWVALLSYIVHLSSFQSISLLLIATPLDIYILSIRTIPYCPLVLLICILLLSTQ